MKLTDQWKRIMWLTHGTLWLDRYETYREMIGCEQTTSFEQEETVFGKQKHMERQNMALDLFQKAACIWQVQSVQNTFQTF